MTKGERSHTDEVYVVGFVPCPLLPKKRPCSFDPLLHPLLTEIDNSFISGMLCNNLTLCTRKLCTLYTSLFINAEIFNYLPEVKVKSIA